MRVVLLVVYDCIWVIACSETERQLVLTIHYGDVEGVIYNTSTFFNNVYSPEWFEDELALRMIRSVDRSTVLGPNAIESRVLGAIPPEKLSSGVKTLLLMLFMPERVYNASNCGDNCAYWILEVASIHDVAISLYHIMDFGNPKFTVRVANTGAIVHSMDELVLIAADCLRGDA